MAVAVAARVARAEPDATCAAICRAAADTPLPTCEVCPATNVCSDLLHQDRAAYDQCVARNMACQERSFRCSEALAAGVRARDACAARPDAAACCAARCTGDLAPPLSTAPRWLLVEALMAPVVRHVPGDTSLRFAAGLEASLLYGSSSWRPPRLPIRIGPFLSATVQLGGKSGAELAAGLTLLVRGRSSGNSGFGSALRISAGGLRDLEPDLPDRFGGLLRLGFGVSTVGPRTWKPVSAGFFVEGHWIPDPAGARTEILLGLQIAPASFPFLFVPGAGDR